MPRRSVTGNVRKICACTKWKTCAHPWYLDFQRDTIRYRANLDHLVGRHARDLVEAQDEARRAIDAKLAGRNPRELQPTDDPTLAQLLEAYDSTKGGRRDRWQIGRICRIAVDGRDGRRPFGDWRASTITDEALEQFRSERPLVAGNRDLALLRAVFNWAVGKRLLPASPFRHAHVAIVKLKREEPRSRRLQPGEEERLLPAAGRVRDLVTAALETGCRLGELLSLQWHQVRFTPRAELFLPAQKTKAKRDRRIPISQALSIVLERRRRDPAGDPLPADAFVLGDEIGRPRGSIKTAWRLTCRRAQIVDLHFHDLRREAGSRWMDAGVPLATIQRWLGHANISQTSTYLGASLGNDERDMRAYEERIGRVPGLTQIDAPRRSDGAKPIASDRDVIEKPEQKRIEGDPIETVH
jgi:integrase